MRVLQGREGFQRVFIMVLVLGIIQFFVIHRWNSDVDIRKPISRDLVKNVIGENRELHQKIKRQSIEHFNVDQYPRARFPNRRQWKHKSREVILDLRLINDNINVSGDINYIVSPLLCCSEKYFKPNYQPLLYGFERTNIGFLTIGIPSIRRPNADTFYLLETLDSILNNTTPNDRRVLSVIVLLSDTNQTYNIDTAGILYHRYTEHFDSGLMRTIQVPHDIYPDMDNIRETYHDGKQRVQWRAKQNIDFAYLLKYSENISEYYLQLEDDVISSKGFLSDIRNLTRNDSSRWFMLEFSSLGFIGKLFRSSDLSWIARFLLTYFDLMPCDILIGKMRQYKGQLKPLHYHVSLFQHIGKFSSLKDKMMPKIDSKFKDTEQTKRLINFMPKGVNPKAELLTNFITHANYSAQNVYDRNVTTFFWAINPKRNNFFTVEFEKPLNISRIIITTGDGIRKSDILEHAHLIAEVIGPTGLGPRNKRIKITDFVDGEVDTKAMGLDLPKHILGLNIVVQHQLKHWVIIRNIIII